MTGRGLGEVFVVPEFSICGAEGWLCKCISLIIHFRSVHFM